MTDDNDDICGETYDHDLDVTYEDVDGRDLICRRCGVELWEENGGE